MKIENFFTFTKISFQQGKNKIKNDIALFPNSSRFFIQHKEVIFTVHFISDSKIVTEAKDYSKIKFPSVVAPKRYQFLTKKPLNFKFSVYIQLTK